MKLLGLAMLLAAMLMLSGCGFANGMTGKVVRSVPNTVLSGGF